MPHECTNCGLTFPDGSKEMLSGCPDCGGNKFQFHPGGTSSDGTPSAQSTGETPSPSSTGADTPGDQPPRSSSRSDVPSGSPSGPGSLSSPESSTSPEAASERSRGDTTASNSTDSSFTLGSLRSEETDSDPSPDTEDRAQASARSTVTPGDQLHTSDSGRSSHTARSDPDPSKKASGARDDDEETADIGTTGDPEDTANTETTGDTGTTGDVPERSDDSDPPDISELREELNEQFESIKIHARGEYELNLMELYDREEHIIALQEDGRYVIDVPSSWREPDEEA